MFKKTDLNLILLIVFITFSSIIMFSLNRYYYRYPGLFYFDPVFLASAFLFMMVRYGLKLQFNIDYQHTAMNMLKEASRYSIVIVVILFSTSAVQYTPFSPIDKKIIRIEQCLNLDLQAVIAWLNANAMLKKTAKLIYDSLGLQLLVIPCFVLLKKKYHTLYEFYCLVLITWILGSTLYYFFPTMGPASVIDSPYFISAQRHTGLKFWQLHHYIQPENPYGGMIAMPSFHVIWAWLCVYMLRHWSLLCCMLAIMNLVLVMACVFLGWHYFLDVLGSILVLMIAHVIYGAWDQSNQLSPADMPRDCLG